MIYRIHAVIHYCEETAFSSCHLLAARSFSLHFKKRLGILFIVSTSGTFHRFYSWMRSSIWLRCAGM